MKQFYKWKMSLKIAVILCILLHLAFVIFLPEVGSIVLLCEISAFAVGRVLAAAFDGEFRE